MRMGYTRVACMLTPSPVHFLLVGLYPRLLAQSAGTSAAAPALLFFACKPKEEEAALTASLSFACTVTLGPARLLKAASVEVARSVMVSLPKSPTRSLLGTLTLTHWAVFQLSVVNVRDACRGQGQGHLARGGSQRYGD